MVPASGWPVRVTKKPGKEERNLREYRIMEDELGGRRKKSVLGE